MNITYKHVAPVPKLQAWCQKGFCCKQYFSSSPLSFSKHLSKDENMDIFGKCNHTHGHNYQDLMPLNVENVHLGGGNKTPFLCFCPQMAIIEPLDHKDLDNDVDYFANVTSSTENLAMYIWNSLEKILPSGCLYKVKIYESDKNFVVFKGN
ncbi:PREDICTED: 6-pyruvoyl tetrahydrobiopterin synthase [Thamnophis sirtalis]|uniref:6-pyruvoyltetrahydropterin synthase n=1 Tax=Thamnophis sirtalis TaxID=35019 RepID=A0A6I9Y2F2_9SAUR|nr:PREDICTED: 6-pyruvoyl tetrahydrobiopterin synthase [Thamnophis sirtalis]